MTNRNSENKTFKNKNNDETSELMVEGRNPVKEALKAGIRTDRLYVAENSRDGSVSAIISNARKQGIAVNVIPKEKLDSMSSTGRHQGIILMLSAVEYSDVDEIIKYAEEKGEKPFIFILDGIVDPHNLGAMIRTANLVGAHGVIIPKHRAASLTSTVAKASSGAVYHTRVAKVTNIAKTIDDLKEKGLWMVCADAEGELMYDLDLRGSIGLVIGNEGSGVSKLVREKCDFTAKIPMKGDIDSLNASVACGVLAYEIYRQNFGK